MVRIHPDPPRHAGAVAQLGEHLLCKQGVVGSIPSSSTNKGAAGGSRLRQSPEASGAILRLLLVSRTGSYRLFFNNTEEAKQSRATGEGGAQAFFRARGAGWVGLYRPAVPKVGGGGGANARDASSAALSVMGSSD